jgi:hypothetical protein
MLGIVGAKSKGNKEDSVKNVPSFQEEAYGGIAV